MEDNDNLVAAINELTSAVWAMSENRAGPAMSSGDKPKTQYTDKPPGSATKDRQTWNGHTMPFCPDCGMGSAVRQDKEDSTKYYCWMRLGGCGATDFLDLGNQATAPAAPATPATDTGGVPF